MKLDQQPRIDDDPFEDLSKYSIILNVGSPMSNAVWCRTILQRNVKVARSYMISFENIRDFALDLLFDLFLASLARLAIEPFYLYSHFIRHAPLPTGLTTTESGVQKR